MAGLSHLNTLTLIFLQIAISLRLLTCSAAARLPGRAALVVSMVQDYVPDLTTNGMSYWLGAGHGEHILFFSSCPQHSRMPQQYAARGITSVVVHGRRSLVVARICTVRPARIRVMI